MKTYEYEDLIIEVLNEPTYRINSSDNNFTYLKHYFGEGGQGHPISQHGIRVIKNKEILHNCVLIASGGGTGIHQNSSLLDGNTLLVCCCNTVFCLSIPNLTLNWKVKADQATCFQIFKQDNGYIVHGELQITKLDKSGNVMWEFGGADIFVSIDGEEEFVFEQDGIVLTDFAKTKYKIDFDGNLIWDTYKG